MKNIILTTRKSIALLLQRTRNLVCPTQATRRSKIIRWSLFGLLLLVAIFSYLTNPFVRFSVVSDPHNEIVLENDQFGLNLDESLILKDDAFFSNLAFVKSGWHIFSSKLAGGPKAQQATVDEIIAAIHQKRFDPEFPFIISGDHFSVLYPRSLGIFYHTILDPRTAINETDWRNRQLIYLKTVAYALEVYGQSDRLSTTIVPVGPRSVALMNIYAPPSDTLYSVLYGLQSLLSDSFLQENYPYESLETYVPEIQTRQAAELLLDRYRDDLRRHLNQFLRDVVDPATGLVKTDILLAGTKDMAKKESGFYDNVMVWKSKQLAQELGVVEENELELIELKQRIIDAFWLEEEGYFLEDLSERGIAEKYYSSDWLIAYQTGFLDPENEADLAYLERSVDYIQRNAIDQPFGVQYHSDPRRHQLYLWVRTFAPDYGSTAIWSNWGMEYTKLLAHLAQVTGEQLYINQADQQISSYAFNIKRYRGYPEVYNENGDFFSQRLYKSIRQTGWVVTFEQAREMVEWTEREMSGQNPTTTSTSE